MSGTAGLVQTVNQLRRAFPAQVTADTLRKLGIAPNNETYVLNILKFVGVLDSDNKKGPQALSVFNKHDETEFQNGFAKLIATSYSDLFELYGDSAWSLSQDKLIAYFRNTDHTSDVVGKRQASTFIALANIAGKSHGSATVTNAKPKKSDAPRVTNVPAKTKKLGQPSTVDVVLPVTQISDADIITAKKGQTDQNHAMALTVRVEINLPAGGDQDTYDRIFKSIRANLLNGDVA
jgi:hypothetical protein